MTTRRSPPIRSSPTSCASSSATRRPSTCCGAEPLRRVTRALRAGDRRGEGSALRAPRGRRGAPDLGPGQRGDLRRPLDRSATSRRRPSPTCSPDRARSGSRRSAAAPRRATFVESDPDGRSRRSRRTCRRPVSGRRRRRAFVLGRRLVGPRGAAALRHSRSSTRPTPSTAGTSSSGVSEPGSSSSNRAARSSSREASHLHRVYHYGSTLVTVARKSFPRQRHASARRPGDDGPVPGILRPVPQRAPRGGRARPAALRRGVRRRAAQPGQGRAALSRPRSASRWSPSASAPYRQRRRSSR